MEPQMVLFNLYDDWLKSISSYTVSNVLTSVLSSILELHEALWFSYGERG